MSKDHKYCITVAMLYEAFIQTVHKQTAVHNLPEWIEEVHEKNGL